MEKGLIGEAYGILESAFDELKSYEEDKDPTHIRQASEKGWSAVVLTVDYGFARLGIMEFIHSRRPDRRDMWTLYTHERRILTKELERLAKVAEEKKELHDLGDEDYKREGISREEFKKFWKETYDSWNPEDKVNVLRFEVME